MATPLPLNLLILRTVEEYGQMPKSLLYSRISASQQEIERQIQALVERGALRVEGNQVSIGS
jgi:hypothetical protein